MTMDYQTFHANSAASTNTRSVTKGRTRLKTLAISNIGAAVAFAKLYDQTTAPDYLTDVPQLVIPIAAGTVQALDFGDAGLLFNLGLSMCVTNLAADNDNTAIAASQVKYKGSFALD
jgi:hypothetical protein